MSFKVLLTRGAQQDMDRLYDFLLEREFGREDGDPDLTRETVGVISGSLRALERFPFTCRKAALSPFLRELVMACGHTGYVALFEIVDDKTVVVSAIRHQREDDYH